MKIQCLAFILLTLTCTIAQAKHAQTQPLSISIGFIAQSLSSPDYTSRGVFFVNTSVKNESDSDQKITVWTQAGWSWLSDNPHVMPGIEALKNAPATITIKPHTSYDSAAEIFIDKSTKLPITFRLGFYPNASVPVSGMIVKPPANQIIWSNPVTLDTVG